MPKFNAQNVRKTILIVYGLCSLLLMGEEPTTTMGNIPLHTPMYTAQYIRQNFVKSNELDNIVGGIVPKYVTNVISDILAPANFEVVYSNKTVVATNIFEVTPFVMNTLMFKKGDSTPTLEYDALDYNVVEPRGSNHNYSLMLDNNGLATNDFMCLDLSHLYADNHVWVNVPTNEFQQVIITQEKLPIVVRMEEPQLGYIIITIKSLNELDGVSLRDIIRFSR